MLRERSGTYSDKSVVVLGIAAPRPRPVRKRSSDSATVLPANALARLNRPNSAIDATSSFLRPKRSDNGPTSSAPTARPMGAALITTPKLAFEMPHSRVMSGARKPMMATSMPSVATIRKHRPSISHWYPDMPRSLM